MKKLFLLGLVLLIQGCETSQKKEVEAVELTVSECRYTCSTEGYAFIKVDDGCVCEGKVLKPKLNKVSAPEFLNNETK